MKSEEFLFFFSLLLVFSNASNLDEFKVNKMNARNSIALRAFHFQVNRKLVNPNH